MNYLTPAIALFRQVLDNPAVVVSGPRTLPARVEGATLPSTLIVQPVPAAPAPGAAIQTVGYTLRCYGQATDDAIDLYDALYAALVNDQSEPLMGLRVSGAALVPARDVTWYAHLVALGTPGGPDFEAGGGWPVMQATAAIDWATRPLTPAELAG